MEVPSIARTISKNVAKWSVDLKYHFGSKCFQHIYLRKQPAFSASSIYFVPNTFGICITAISQMWLTLPNWPLAPYSDDLRNVARQWLASVNCSAAKFGPKLFCSDIWPKIPCMAARCQLLIYSAKRAQPASFANVWITGSAGNNKNHAKQLNGIIKQH